MGGRNPPRFFALQNFGESKMTKTQRQALRELKQRNKYRQRCERESERHMRRMLAMKSPALSDSLQKLGMLRHPIFLSFVLCPLLFVFFSFGFFFGDKLTDR